MKTLRISKIYIYGSALAEVKHSDGSSTIQLNPEYHFIEGDQGEDEKCLSADGADFLESELKGKTGSDEVEWTK